MRVLVYMVMNQQSLKWHFENVDSNEKSCENDNSYKQKFKTIMI